MNLQYKNYKTKKEYVFHHLNEEIFTGRLNPGSRLEYQEIADKLNVSLNPVREAMHQLETNGLVEIVPRQGAYVSMHSEKYLSDIYDVKISLEIKAARLAVENINDAGLKHLKSIIEMTEKDIEDDMLTCALLNKEFHTAICSYSNNLYLEKIIEDIWDIIFRYSLSMFSKEGVKRNLKEHYLMLELIEDGDVDELVSLMYKHQINAKDVMIKVVENHAKNNN